jgi:hypothetical protein
MRRFELAEESILIGHAGAHGVDYVHAYDHILSRGARGREEENRCKRNSNRSAPLYDVHPVLPYDCERAAI